MGDDTDRAASVRLHLDRPSSARIYDYMLNGAGPNNYAIDRAFGDQQAEVLPDMRKAMRENRRFIGRVVRVALESGIRQFLDIGSGLPSQGQTHEVADQIAPDAQARVVYVDNELIAHAHSEILLDDEADALRHKAVLADFFNHGDLWRKVTATGLIDPAEPTCVLITAILHFMSPEDRPDVPMQTYRDRLVPGSMLVLTHVPHDPADEALQTVADAYANTANPAHLRTDDEFSAFFGGWPLLEPGITWTGLWRPREDRTEEPWWGEDNKYSLDGEPWWGERPGRMLYRGGAAIKPDPS
jgi:hypothetical protein